MQTVSSGFSSGGGCVRGEDGDVIRSHDNQPDAIQIKLTARVLKTRVVADKEQAMTTNGAGRAGMKLPADAWCLNVWHSEEPAAPRCRDTWKQKVKTKKRKACGDKRKREGGNQQAAQ